MFVSQDGTVTGSIDVSRLDEVKPKTDEARAQLDALKAERKVSREESERDAERMAEVARAQNPVLQQSGQEGQDAERQRAAERQQNAADNTAPPAQSEDVTKLQAEAEQAGVVVDKRWGADRLRQEIDASKAASARKPGR